MLSIAMRNSAPLLAQRYSKWRTTLSLFVLIYLHNTSLSNESSNVWNNTRSALAPKMQLDSPLITPMKSFRYITTVTICNPCEMYLDMQHEGSSPASATKKYTSSMQYSSYVRIYVACLLIHKRCVRCRIPVSSELSMISKLNHTITL